MKFILGAPGTGKTKELLRMSAENKVPVLCESVQSRSVFNYKTLLLKISHICFIIVKYLTYICHKLSFPAASQLLIISSL